MTGLRWLARSRLRLVLAALLSLGAAAGLTPTVAAFVRGGSTSPTSDMLALSGWLFLLLPGCACLTVMLGERLWGEPWRRQAILGEPPPPDPDGGPPVSEPPRLFAMSALVVILTTLSAQGLSTWAGDLFTDYGRIGFARTMLRSPQTSSKLDVLTELGERHRQAKVEPAIPLLQGVVDDVDQPVAVRAAAVRALGAISRTLADSVASWRDEEGVRDPWELAALRALRVRLAQTLPAHLRQGPPELGAEAALALGSLRVRPGLAPLVEVVSAGPEALGDDRRAVWRAAAVGLGLGRDASIAMEPLLGALDAALADDADRLSVTWATGEVTRTYVPDTDDAVEALFGDLVESYGAALGRVPPVARCELVHVLSLTGDARSIPPLMKAFEAPDAADAECPKRLVDLGERVEHLAWSDVGLRLRIGQALARVAVGQRELQEWARAQLDTGGHDPVVTKQLEAMASLLDD